MPFAGKTRDLFPSTLPAEARDGVGRPATRRPIVRPATLLSPIPREESQPRLASQLWLAIHLPRLALECQREIPADVPFIVAETAGNRQTVSAVNAVAERAAIQPGMDLNAAYALNSRLTVVARDLKSESLELQRLAVWAGRFTPKVSIEGTDTLLLEVKSSLHLFGGEQGLIDTITQALEKEKFTAILALAPTSLAAVWFSHAGVASRVTSIETLSSHLSQLTLQKLRWPVEVIDLLRDTGVLTVGDCLRLPREGFAKRYGTGLLLQLDQALNRAAQPRRFFIAREKFEERCDFDMEIESTAQLSWALQPMLEQLEKFLRVRQAGIQALQITLQHRELPGTKIRLRFLSPAGNYKDLALLLNERLARTELVAPALGAQIRSSSLWVMPGENAAIFRQKQPRSADFSRLLERLRLRLGDEAVYGIEAVADHRPEAAWKKNFDLLNKNSGGDAEPVTLPRPAWLLTLPMLLEVKEARPFYQGRLRIEQGPERIETGWWDGQGIARDYYVASTEQFRRIWIFRERHTSGRWFLHGYFS